MMRNDLGEEEGAGEVDWSMAFIVPTIKKKKKKERKRERVVS